MKARVRLQRYPRFGIPRPRCPLRVIAPPARSQSPFARGDFVAINTCLQEEENVQQIIGSKCLDHLCARLFYGLIYYVAVNLLRRRERYK